MEYTASYSDDLYQFTFSDPPGIDIRLERFEAQDKGDVRAETVVTSASSVNGGELFRGYMHLVRASGQNSLKTAVDALALKAKEIAWGNLLGAVRRDAINRYRNGDPLVVLTDVDVSSAHRYLVRPFVIDGAASVFYGDGASMKSIMALVMGIAVASGEPVAGVAPDAAGPVLYMDWEDDPETHAERLAGLLRASGSTLRYPIYYQRMTASMHDVAKEMKRKIADRGIRFAILDSVGMASGGDPNEAGTIIKTMMAARTLGVPVLCIHHLAKDAGDKSKPIGSSFASNEVRISWLVEKDQELSGETKSRIKMRSYKSNRTGKLPEFFFEAEFVNNGDLIREIRLGQIGQHSLPQEPWYLQQKEETEDSPF